MQLSESLGSIWCSYNKVISRKIELGEVCWGWGGGVKRGGGVYQAVPSVSSMKRS